MAESNESLPLVIGLEIRPVDRAARLVLEREDAERLGGAIAEDLAHCVEAVTGAHLVVGPALLEPGQVLSPGHAPWPALERIAARHGTEPGVTSLGAVGGRLSHDLLLPLHDRPTGLFLCLPMVLRAAADRDALSRQLEERLFDSGSARPPLLSALSEATGLDFVHGQFLTRTDLMALVKVQLAGAGLDPFWEPVEHALLEPRRPAEIELPAGIGARWEPDSLGWTLRFEPVGSADDLPGDLLRLRAFRQATALLESHFVPWRAEAGSEGVRIDDRNRWAVHDRGPVQGAPRAVAQVDAGVGLVAWSAVVDARRIDVYPLASDALSEAEQWLRDQGVEDIETADGLRLDDRGLVLDA
ncbi:MAG: hypothetical protein R3323_02880 [Wenzhouxiangellaceae bacterium]|nr:hypothetical protein [Wenzhouxiangellaceae bacterium]